MTLRVDTDVIDDGVDAILARVNQGPGDNGSIEFYTGTRPENLSDPPSGTLLAVIEYENPAFGASSNTTASALGVPLTTTGIEDGDIGWARILDADGNALWDDDDIGTEAQRNITVNTLGVTTGVAVDLVSHDFGMDDET